MQIRTRREDQPDQRRSTGDAQASPKPYMDTFFLQSLLNQELPTIDLHDIEFIQEALDQLETKLFAFSNAGEHYCRIIHGIGAGVLAEAVHEVLNKNPLVTEWKEEESGGSCIVLF